MQSEDPNAFLPLLQIDDSRNERALVAQAIFLTRTPFTFHQATGFESAMPYFQSQIEPDALPRPALILLDYNLGENTGVEFLYWLRLMKKITSIPVVMFSSSANTREIAECYSTGANHFINKPTDLGRLKIIVRALHQSLVPYQRPGILRLLAEYQPDPRELSDSAFKVPAYHPQKSRHAH